MSRQSQLPSRLERDTEARVKALIQSSSQLQPWGSRVDFASDKWTVPAERAGHPGSKTTFDFGKITSSFRPIVKSYVNAKRASNGAKPGGFSKCLTALRFLDSAMKNHAIHDPIYLTSRQFDEAETDILSIGLERNYAAALSRILRDFGRYLFKERLTVHALRWEPTIKRKGQNDVFSQEMRQASKAMLPRRDALIGFSKLEVLIKQRLREGDARARLDLILYHLIVILFATGLRANEVLTLPLEFLVHRTEVNKSGAERSVPYLVRRTSKRGKPDLKMLSPLAEKLCRRAQTMIRFLTRPAREEANWLANNPGQVRFNFDNNAHVSRSEIHRIFGLTAADRLYKKLATRSSRGRYYLSALNLRSWLVQQRFDAYVDQKSKQSLQDSLAISFPEWGGTTGSRFGYMIVKPISYSKIKVFLSGNSVGNPSAFQKYLGANLVLQTHQFRRLLDTVAREGGMSENELALLQGRSRPSGNRAYDYRTPEERAEQVRSAIQRGEAFGWVSQFYWELPMAERDVFLEAAAPFAYETPMGSCLGNIVEDPCPYHLSCLSGCGDFIHVKGDLREIDGLERVMASTTRALTSLESLPAGGHADNHRAHLLRQLQGAWAALAIEEDPSAPFGCAHRVFANNTSFGDQEEA